MTSNNPRCLFKGMICAVFDTCIDQLGGKGILCLKQVLHRSFWSAISKLRSARVYLIFLDEFYNRFPWFISIDVRFLFAITRLDRLDMVFTAPAVHYSALATTPPKVDASNSQPLIKWNQIIKRFFRSDDRQLSETTAGSSEMKHWSNETDLSIVKPCSTHADQTTLSDRVETEAPKIPSTLVGPTERLPFSGPYLSSAPNNERESSKLSSYHRHCTRQEKFVHQKQYPSTTNYSDPSDSPTAGKESSSNFVSYRLQNSVRPRLLPEYSTWVIVVNVSSSLRRTEDVFFWVRRLVRIRSDVLESFFCQLTGEILFLLVIKVTEYQDG